MSQPDYYCSHGMIRSRCPIEHGLQEDDPEEVDRRAYAAEIVPEDPRMTILRQKIDPRPTHSHWPQKPAAPGREKEGA